VGRNFSTWRSALAWIKNQQDSPATPENQKQIIAPYDFQSKSLLVKSLRGG
jgi:hypothetical protein